jgi:hypothetical protein
VVCEHYFLKLQPGTGTHTCNPSYSGGRDQEDHGSKPVWTNHENLSQKKKKKPQNWVGGVTQGVGPEFKSQYRKQKTKQNPLDIPGVRVQYTIIGEKTGPCHINIVAPAGG